MRLYRISGSCCLRYWFIYSLYNTRVYNLKQQTNQCGGICKDNKQLVDFLEQTLYKLKNMKNKLSSSVFFAALLFGTGVMCKTIMCNLTVHSFHILP